MAALNEQRFIRELARALGITEAAAETALHAAMVNACCDELTLTLRVGTVVVAAQSQGWDAAAAVRRGRELGLLEVGE